MNEFSIIGSSPPRVDALEKVTGKAMFTADFMMPRMLSLKIVRSSQAHARIIGIDTSKAERLFGVRGFVRPEDAPDKKTGSPIRDRYLLPSDGVVRFIGEPIVLVAADTAAIADEAVELVKVNYEELPAVFDAEESMKKEPPVIIHPERASYYYEPSPRYPEMLDPAIPNLFNMAILCTGDVEKGFKEADLIVENKYTCESQQHCPLEPHIVDAWFDPDGTLTIRTSRQAGYHSLQEEISQFFDIPPSRVRIVGPYLGGGFGSKQSIILELLAALAAIKIGKPIRAEYNRQEDITTGGRRPGTTIYLKHGAQKDGTLLAVEAKVIVDGGAYASERIVSTPRIGITGGIGGVYRIPNVKAHSYGVYTNCPPSAAFRGVGAPEVVWAVEQQMDIMAEKLGIDPVELRMKNILNEGEESPIGEITESIGVRECLKRVSDWIGWGKKPEAEANWVKGKGIAIGPALCGRGYPATSWVKVLSDGTLEVGYGAAELGQGAQTVVAQIVAEEFNIPISRVRVVYGDTKVTPWDFYNRASRTTIATGNAVIRACQDAKEQLLRLASVKMGLALGDLDIGNGKIYRKDWTNTSIPIAALFTPQGFVKGVGEIVGRGEFNSSAPPILSIETGRFEKFAIWGYGACAVEVGVNLETWEVKVFRIAGAFDVGQPINPKMCEQQIEGGMGMGIGTTLYEELRYKHGRLLNPDFKDYKIPTAAEIPSGESAASFIVKCPHKDGPYGAKGFGEVVLVPVAPAIGNALRNAIGVRLYGMPLIPEKVFEAIVESKEKVG